jgi:nucleotide-binding universal stress UspA family protein
MVMKKLLVCVDGSKYSDEAVKHTVEIAKKFDSEITLMFAWAPPATGGRTMVVHHDIPDVEMERLEGAITILRDNGLTYRIVKAIGNPAKEIIEESKKGYDLVIMGSRGLGAIEGFLLGSVTSRVSHHIDVPLMIVHSKG